jgi:hypothetical protein
MDDSLRIPGCLSLELLLIFADGAEELPPPPEDDDEEE